MEWLAEFFKNYSGRNADTFVSKKRVISILPKMRGVVETLNRRCLATLSRPLRWAIIDDECDSVTSGAQGASTPPVIREICEVGECVYVGYTATAQANLFNPDIHQSMLPIGLLQPSEISSPSCRRRLQCSLLPMFPIRQGASTKCIVGDGRFTTGAKPGGLTTSFTSPPVPTREGP